MKLLDLESAVLEHTGEFLCEAIGDEQKTKVVHFVHSTTPPAESSSLPAIGRLQEFYDTFGSIVFYWDEKSCDAARYIAPTSQWAELSERFSDWITDFDEEERSEFLPGGVDTCLVIGEIPCSGNYILMPTIGPRSGYVFEFDHDGYEFIEVAKDLVEYVIKLLKPDSAVLVEIASHMRFIDETDQIQWWIHQLTDNRGHVVKTKL